MICVVLAWDEYFLDDFTSHEKFVVAVRTLY